MSFLEQLITNATLGESPMFAPLHPFIGMYVLDTYIHKLDITIY